ncbi:hypothetical protein GCM10010193_55180 [Kitasatospora atroaurantiaca]
MNSGRAMTGMGYRTAAQYEECADDHRPWSPTGLRGRGSPKDASLGGAPRSEQGSAMAEIQRGITP